MSFAADAPVLDHRRPPPVGPPPNLSSNNPFRNFSPSPRSTTFPGRPANPRPMSTNPFLDASEPTAASSMSNKKTSNNYIPDDIFNELSLLDRPAVNFEDFTNISQRSAPSTQPESRPLVSPPNRSGPPPPYRPIGFEHGRPSARSPRGVSGSNHELCHNPHQRRASESSVIERRPRIERDSSQRRERTASEELRRRERRKEREERHKREKEKTKNRERSEKGRKKAKKPQGLDLIDKLDVTGIYGQGLFHHDGPFDACNPHRNAKKDQRAPMQAFPEGSANMALGGAGPLNSRLDLDKFHGRGVDAFSEYAQTRKHATSIVDPKGNEAVHGEETSGLGTSTFLEGAPASKSALQRRISDDADMETAPTGGLSRKRSIAQRFRGMSATRRNGPPDLRSPEARCHQTSSDPESPPFGQPAVKAFSPAATAYPQHAKEEEINPFDNDYETAFERKGNQIRTAEQARSAHAPMVRSKTTDAGLPTRGRGYSIEEDRLNGGGFLSRMKSFKGGPRKI